MTKLATLLASLVTEITSGVVSASVDATEKERELLAGLDANPEALVDDRTVQAFLQDRFPPLEGSKADGTAGGANDGGTAIRTGAVYVRPDEYEHAAEFPPIEDELGIELDDAELHSPDGQTVLTDSAVDRVEGAVRRRLGEGRRDVLEGVAEYGMPRPEVTDVDVGIPLTFDDDLEVSVVHADDDIDPAAVGHLTVHIEYRRN